MHLTDGGKKFLTQTIWIYVAMFAVEAVVSRHRNNRVFFWACFGSFALLFPPAIYFTTRRMLDRLQSKG